MIEELLGEGGMGQVYRAFDATLNRRVAIKLLRGDRDATLPGAPSRVLREARMAAALDHPNVVSIFDFGEAVGTPFIVMELVHGRPLRAWIGKSDVPMLERVHWLAGVARGLGAAHRAGLVHRDVKPENVLVRDDGVVKVLDFGIARLEHPSMRPPPMDGAAAGPREKSTMVGTPAYMAPEQIRGEAVDSRADQFAWGVVAYELLTGKLPWTSQDGGEPGEHVSLLTAILEQKPAPLSLQELGVPAPFSLAVMRALAKRPEARFASMEELLAAAGMASQRDPSGRSLPPADIASAPTLLATNSAGALATAASGALSRARQRRTRAVVTVVAIASCVAMVGAGFAWRGGRRSGDGDATRDRGAVAPATSSAPLVFHPRDPRRLTFDQGCEEYPTLAADGRTVVYDTTAGDDIEIAAIDLARGDTRRLTSEPGWHFAPTASPDGTRVAYVRQRGDEVGAWIASVDGASPPRLLAPGRVRPSWSPDGSAVWAGPADGPRRIDVATGATTRTLEPPPGYFLVRMRELADGRVVARLLDRETKRGRGLVIYAAGSSGPPATLFADATDDAMVLAPGGASLLVPKVLVPTDRVELWQVPLDGAPASIVPSNVVLPTKGLDVARDGAAIVWSTCSTEQDIARVAGAEKLDATALFPKTEWADEQPAGVPGAGALLVVVSDRDGRRKPWVLDASGHASPRPLPVGDVDVASPSVSPDGRLVAFTAIGAGIRVVALDGASPARAVTTGATDTKARFARDGASLYFETASAGGARAIARVPVDGGAPSVVVDRAERPAPSPTDDALAYVAMEGEQGTPMLRDGATGRARRLSPSLAKGAYGAIAFAPDGKRAVVARGLNELVEVDVATGAIARRFASGDQITSLTYVGKDIVVSRQAWRGDVWLARDAW